ncbi:MAG: cell division protein FtsL [Marinosulfonomonas sp.]|nr:cell division protein FtsL [Marinosulfonomonas sp.]
MRPLLYVLSALAVMGLAFWAYHENYKTQQALRDVEKLQRDIGGLREELGVLRAEWAYLNRPDRLRELADINYDRLGLLPLTPQQFGRIDQISFPLNVLKEMSQPIDLAARLESSR